MRIYAINSVTNAIIVFNDTYSDIFDISYTFFYYTYLTGRAV